MTIRTLRRLNPLRDWLVPFALALLLLSQSLALAHRIVHAPGTAPGVATASHGHGLFGDHTATECRLFDQLAPTDLAPVPVPALAFALHGATAPATEHASPLTARLRAFRARDPPAALA